MAELVACPGCGTDTQEIPCRHCRGELKAGRKSKAIRVMRKLLEEFITDFHQQGLADITSSGHRHGPFQECGRNFRCLRVSQVLSDFDGR